MRDAPQRRQEWLVRHKAAEVIVVDLHGVPVRAEYRTLSDGRYPVAYLYPSDQGINVIVKGLRAG